MLGIWFGYCWLRRASMNPSPFFDVVWALSFRLWDTFGYFSSSCEWKRAGRPRLSVLKNDFFVTLKSFGSNFGLTWSRSALTRWLNLRVSLLWTLSRLRLFSSFSYLWRPNVSSYVWIPFWFLRIYSSFATNLAGSFGSSTLIGDPSTSTVSWAIFSSFYFESTMWGGSSDCSVWTSSKRLLISVYFLTLSCRRPGDMSFDTDDFYA